MTVRIGVVFALACSALCGCASQTPFAPSSDTRPAAILPAQGTLSVVVLDRDSQQPIAGAEVQSTTTAAVTDRNGECRLPASIGEEIEVFVSAAGYESMAASAAPTSNERWTFYLQFASATAGSDKSAASPQAWSRERAERSR